MGLSVALAAFVTHDVYIWANPPTPKYFIVDGEHAPRPVAALDSPIVNDAQLLDWTMKWVRRRLLGECGARQRHDSAGQTKRFARHHPLPPHLASATSWSIAMPSR